MCWLALGNARAEAGLVSARWATGAQASLDLLLVFLCFSKSMVCNSVYKDGTTGSGVRARTMQLLVSSVMFFLLARARQGPVDGVLICADIP